MEETGKKLEPANHLLPCAIVAETSLHHATPPPRAHGAVCTPVARGHICTTRRRYSHQPNQLYLTRFTIMMM